MGSFGKSPYLPQPITQKDTKSGVGKGNLSDVRFGMSSMQGWRITMEDAHVHALPLKENADLAFFGVFDGHGGDLAAKFVAKHLLTYIRNSKAYTAATSEELDPEELGNALTEGFTACDKDLKRFPAVKAEEDSSGSTGVTCFVTPDHIVVANTGDSRLVLCKAGKDEFATVDHKPSNETEEARIVAAGGVVNNNRINGDLAAARAFGDFRFKSDRGLPLSKQLVTVIPDVTCLARSESDQFLILACDGVWDVMSNDEAILFVSSALKLGASIAGACELLLDECIRKSSQDNMSVIVVGLDNLPKREKGKSGQMPTLEQVRSTLVDTAL